MADRRDEYGNQVQQTGTTGGGYGKTTGTGMHGGEYGTTPGTGKQGGGYGATTGTGAMPGSGIGTGVGGQHQPQRPQDASSGLRRSGSGSSSSSEDDGEGGRRKKGLTQKIKEKLPGGGHKDEYGQTTGAQQTQGGYGAQQTQGGYGAGQTQGGYGAEQTQEKKGMMDKIKEKIPGQHKAI